MACNILNGDALACSFPEAGIEGDIVVMREALIDGDLSGKDLQEFWHGRASHLGITITEYSDRVVSEFEKIMKAPADTIFNLWFEYDLFCQVNMWFIISIISSLPIKKQVYAIYTSYLDRNNQHFWNGFGPANTDELIFCFQHKIFLTDTDLQLGADLWRAYKDNNFSALSQLSKEKSIAFPHLEEVVKAHIDRYPSDGSKGRPEKVIENIINTLSTDFATVCKAFWDRESIYGFGDTQVKKLYDKVIRNW